MAVTASFPGLWPLADLELGDHLCLPVDSDRERFAGTARMTGIALRRGGKMLVITHTETPDEMAEHLMARVPGADAALAGGQLELMPCRDFALAGGTFDPEHLRSMCDAQNNLAEQQGYAGLWAVADMTWDLTNPLSAGWLVDCEAAANLEFADRRRVAVCIYNRNMFCPKLLAEVCSAHPMTPGPPSPGA
jgi:uncharacterized protein CbrC (UPF0167 family)